MNKDIKQIISKMLLIQSSDCIFIYSKHNFKINNELDFTFDFEELVELNIVENNIEKNLFTSIISHCKGIIKNNFIVDLTSYRNAENLYVYLKETSEYYVIISIGEYQPSLYRIYIEGVFLKMF